MIHGWLQPFFLVVGSFVDLLWKTMAQVHLLLYNKNILTNDNNYIYIHDIVIYIYIQYETSHLPDSYCCSKLLCFLSKRLKKARLRCPSHCWKSFFSGAS